MASSNGTDPTKCRAGFCVDKAGQGSGFGLRAGPLADDLQKEASPVLYLGLGGQHLKRDRPDRARPACMSDADIR